MGELLPVTPPSNPSIQTHVLARFKLKTVRTFYPSDYLKQKTINIDQFLERKYTN